MARTGVESYSMAGEAVAAAMETIGAQPMANGERPPTGGEEGAGSLAFRARLWFLESWNHPLWKRYIKAAEEDEGYYIGGELQWSKDGSAQDLDRLKQAHRTVVSVNHCQSIVDVLTGFERQNQYDLKAVPQGEKDSDADDAQNMSWLLKYAQDQTETQETQSEVFEDGVIRGMGAINIGVDWQSENPDGDIQVERLRPGKDIIWDPYWTKYDLSDCRYIIRFKWTFLDDLLAQYPDKRQELLSAVSGLDPAFAQMVSDNVTSQGRLEDSYGRTTDIHSENNPDTILQMYDPIWRRLMVLEVWYRVYEKIYLAHNKVTGKVTSSDNQLEMKAIVAADPDRWTLLERTRRRIWMGTVLPSTFQTLEGPVMSPYENDKEHYPFVAYIAKRRGDHIYGVIRNLKDPQLIENKRVSQVLDILGRFGNLRPMAPKGSLEDPRALEDAAESSTIVYDHIRGAPSFLVPPVGELARVITELGVNAKMNIREVSGINTDLLGQKSDNTSGIAIARRQAQGQTIATSFFDNLRRTRKLIGQRLARRIQQCYSTEQVLRLTDAKTGEERIVTINPRDAKDLKDDEYQSFLAKQRDKNRPFFLRDVSALKFDVAISEGPSTPSARNTALLALLEVVGKMPSILPAVVDVIVELADIPERHKIVERLRKMLPDVLQTGPDGQPLPPPPPPPPPPPRVSISLTGDLDMATAHQAATGQPIEPDTTGSPGGSEPPDTAPVAPDIDQATSSALKAVGGSGVKPVPGEGSQSGMAPPSAPIPVPPGVVRNPASPKNPRVVPQVAAKSLSGTAGPPPTK